MRAATVENNPTPFAADEFHTFKIEVSEDETRMSIDGREVRTGERNDSPYTNRIFYVTPDGFDNFYGPAKYTIDWIRLSGPTITPQPTAITPSSWGEVKAR